MKYDFSSILERTGKDSIASDIPDLIDSIKAKEGFSRIPMWVADMNFKTAPSVNNAIIERLNHPIYGYFSPSDEYYAKIINWQKIQFNITDLLPEYIGYENGVLGCVSTALSVFCSKGDKILLHSPTYTGFTEVLENNGYKMIRSPLFKDENGIWRMDFSDMEEKIKKENIQTAIFCSPHNPTGRVWEQSEIEQAMAIFEKYDVNVISDEIWADLTLNDNKHIPTRVVSDDAKNRTISIYAPSKTFNLAGLVGSYHVIYNKKLRDRMRKESSLNHYNSMNVLSMHALIGAYSTEGYEWLFELREVLTQNMNYIFDFFKNKVDGIEVSKPEGTYLIFIDCKKWLENNDKTLDELLQKGYEYGVIWQDGRKFHFENCIRLNFAMPFDQLKEALDRLEKYVFN